MTKINLYTDGSNAGDKVASVAVFGQQVYSVRLPSAIRSSVQKPISPVNLRFYLKLIAKGFTLTVISSSHNHIQHIKSLEKSKMGKSKNFTKQNMQKCENEKYSVQEAVHSLSRVVVPGTLDYISVNTHFTRFL